MSESAIKDNKNLQERLERAQREMTILYDISNAMRTTLELNYILYIILTGVTAHTGLGFNRALLFLVNNKERVLEGTMAIGPESGEEAQKIWTTIETEHKNFEDMIAAYKLWAAASKKSSLSRALANLKIPLNADTGGVLAAAYVDGTPMHIGKERLVAYTNDPLLKVFKTTELIIMPLKAKDKVNGLIIADNLYTQKPITEHDLKIFTMLANQAGHAIENSQLYEMVVHKSRTDSLTGLWNHGFFQDALGLEIEKTRNTNVPLSLIMIDIDNFKPLNDNFGHRNGDAILTELSKILKESSRDIDYVCRYGGEEFAVIVNGMDAQQTFAIAERLRETIAHHAFRGFSTSQAMHVTVSLGIATFPHTAANKEDLIQKADQAMYTAKFIGKNTTCVAEE